MGNLIYYPGKSSANKTIFQKIDPCFQFLCNCNNNTGSKSNIIKLYKNFLRLHFGKSFFCVKSEVKRISYNTRLEGYEELLFSYFTLKSVTKVNIMEVFSAVIIFAEMTWKEKVLLTFKIFDFDGSKNISEDELFIMCRCFIEAVSVITRGQSCSNNIIRDLIYDSKQELLSYEEYFLLSFVAWVKKNPIIFQTLELLSVSGSISQSSPQNKKKIIKTPFKINQTFDKRDEKKNFHRRTQSSQQKMQEPNYLVVVDGVPVTKMNVFNLKKIFDSANRTGMVTGSDLCKSLTENRIENFGKIKADKNYENFRDFIADLYPKADSGQVARILALINSNF